MRKVIGLAFFISVNCIFIYAQNDVCRVDRILNKTQLDEVEKAVSLYWDGKTPEAKQAVELLEKIVQKNADNWVASFWASYISTQVINSERDNTLYLEKAEQYFDNAHAAFLKRPENSAVPYFHALQSLIYRFKSLHFAKQKEQAEFEEFRDKSIRELNKGIAISPDNPVLMVMAATGIAGNRESDLRQTIAAVALLEKAQAEFKKVTDRSPADITYWNEHWINFWINYLKKS